MNAHEITEALDGLVSTLDELIHEPLLDVGQSTMIAQASTRCAQVRKELTVFDLVDEEALLANADEPEDVYDARYEEWHDHGE